MNFYELTIEYRKDESEIIDYDDRDQFIEITSRLDLNVCLNVEGIPRASLPNVKL